MKIYSSIKNIEKRMKSSLKQKFSVTKGVIIRFLMTGLVFSFFITLSMLSHSESIIIFDGSVYSHGTQDIMNKQAVALNPTNRNDKSVGNNVALLSIAIGNSSKAKGVKGVAVGSSASAYGEQGVAVGNNSASNEQSVAIGSDVYATGKSSIAIGNNDISSEYKDKLPDNLINKIYKDLMKNSNNDFDLNKTKFENSYKGMANGIDKKIYSPTYAAGNGAIAIGSRTVAFGKGSTSIGTLSFALADRSTTLGLHSFVSETAVGGTAIGEESRVFASNSIAVGNKTEATSEGSLAYGYNAYAVGKGSIAIGANVAASAYFDNQNFDMNKRSTKLLGFYDTLSNETSKKTTSENPLLKGQDDPLKKFDTSMEEYLKKFDGGLPIRENSKVEITSSIVENGKEKQKQVKKKTVFSNNGNTSQNAIAIGNNSYAVKKNSLALGYGTLADADNSFALGSYTYVKSDAINSIALGVGTTVNGRNSFVAGTSSTTGSMNTVIVGSGSSIGTNSANSVALGYGVSIGNSLSNVLIVGNETTSKAKNVSILGNKANANIENSVVLGNNSTTNYMYKDGENDSSKGGTKKGQGLEPYRPANSSYGVKPEANAGVVSVAGWEKSNGKNDLGKRRIINVAAGALDSDVATVGQLRSLEAARKDDNVVYYVKENGTGDEIVVKLGDGGKFYHVDKSKGFILNGTTGGKEKLVSSAELNTLKIAPKGTTGNGNAKKGPANFQSLGASPIVMGNLGKGEITNTSTDAINGSQIYNLLEKVLGTQGAVNSNKLIFGNPTFDTIKQTGSGKDIKLDSGQTFKTSLNKVIEVMNKGIKINSDTKSEKQIYLGDTISFLSDSWNDTSNNRYVGDNIATKNDNNDGKVYIGIKETPTFKTVSITNDQTNKSSVPKEKELITKQYLDSRIGANIESNSIDAISGKQMYNLLEKVLGTELGVNSQNKKILENPTFDSITSSSGKTQLNNGYTFKKALNKVIEVINGGIKLNFDK